MIKASHPIEPYAVENLEDALYELAPSNWSLIVSQKDGTGDLEGFFDSEKDARLALEKLESILGQAFEKPFRLQELEDRDWKESYKAHFKAWSRGTIHWVPEWERKSYEIPDGHHALYIDPGNCGADWTRARCAFAALSPGLRMGRGHAVRLQWLGVYFRAHQHSLKRCFAAPAPGIPAL